MEQFNCPRCYREFLSEYQLERHYSWNPKHGEPVSIDVRDLPDEGERLQDSNWVEFDDRVETFLRVVDDVDVAELEFRYHPDTGSVVVDGGREIEQTIDVSEVQDLTSDQIQLSFGSGYLKVAFLKQS